MVASGRYQGCRPRGSIPHRSLVRAQRMLPPVLIARDERSRNSLQPRVGGKLRFDKCLSIGVLVWGDGPIFSTGEGAESVFESLDDLGATEPGLATQRINALRGRRRALIAELLASNAQNLGHHLAVDVVRQR